MRITALILVYWPKVACGALGERGRMAAFALAAQGTALGRLLACFRALFLAQRREFKAAPRSFAVMSTMGITRS